MPNYSFKCKKCKEEFEIFLSIKQFEEDEKKCLECGSIDIFRMFKPPSSKIRRSKEEIIEAAKDEARQIAQKISAGDQSTIRDIYGEK